MNREYYRWWSKDLGRDMEMLVFGHAGSSTLVFPTSCGRFFDFEDRGMVGAVREKLENGQLQLFCVDSVDCESWYNRSISPARRVARHIQFEKYLLHDVLPLMHGKNPHSQPLTAGCSFGGYHAVNLVLRHPELFRGFISMSGAFDLKGLGFLHGYYDEECRSHLPLDFLSELEDERTLETLRRGRHVLATGVHDQCWNDNERLACAMRSRSIPVQLDVWADDTGHDWNWWQKMAQTYL